MSAPAAACGLLPGVVLGQAHGSHLRIAENGKRHGGVVDGPEPARVFQIVRHHPGFPVGDMLELVAVGDVAQGIDPVNGFTAGKNPEVRVHGHGVVLRQVKAGTVQAQPVGIRFPSSGHQDDVRCDAQRIAGVVREHHGDAAVAVVLHCPEREAKLERPAVGRGRGEAAGDFGVVPAKQPLRTVHLGHLGPETMEYGSEFGGDISAANHHYPLGRTVDAHHRVRSVHLGQADPRHIGERRS